MRLLQLAILSLLSISLFAHRYDVDFDTSMDFEQTDPKKQQVYNKRKASPLIAICRELYEKNNLTQVSPHDEPIIPKVIHFIWVGPRNLPDVYFRCLYSVQKYLPDWECKLWTDEDIAQLDLENQALYDAETNYGAKSDMVRYEILYSQGGVYLDIDMELVQPLDILNHTYEFYCGVMPCDRTATINNCIIGTTPAHPIIRACIDEVHKRRDVERVEDPMLAVLIRTGPLLFQEVFHKTVHQMEDTSSVIALPKSYFFPVDWNIPETRKELQELIKPETFGIHHWSGSWVEYKPKKGILDKVYALGSWIKHKIVG